jgi:Uncharacterised nucleotidyltransferase
MARPRHVAALVSALQFQNPRPELLRTLDEGEWKQLVAYSDPARLTLILGRAWHKLLPDWVRARIARNLADNTERLARALHAYQELAELLRRAGAEHLVLKGFSQWPHFVSDLRLRPQADLDLYCPADSLLLAREAALSIGYQQGLACEHHIGDHLPLLVRPEGRHWRGNAFDPEISQAIELHHQFWGRSYARFGPRNLKGFWERRRACTVGGIQFDALDPLDAFAYASLHALRHLLYGGLAPASVHELGFFLHENAADEHLWTLWRARHDEQLRRLIAISSLLAAQWFGCRLPAAVEDEVHRLPAIVPRWIARFGGSALVNPYRLDKSALWLQLGLIDSERDRFFVLCRRLFPLWIPSLNSRWVQEGQDGVENTVPTPRGRMMKSAAYFNWFARRVVRHLKVLPSTLWYGFRLWSS